VVEDIPGPTGGYTFLNSLLYYLNKWLFFFSFAFK
jgi:hypothetical protein